MSKQKKTNTTKRELNTVDLDKMDLTQLLKLSKKLTKKLDIATQLIHDGNANLEEAKQLYKFSGLVIKKTMAKISELKKEKRNE